MNWDAIRAIAETARLIAVIATLFYQRVQIHQNGLHVVATWWSLHQYRFRPELVAAIEQGKL
jgi:hypothetical protein